MAEDLIKPAQKGRLLTSIEARRYSGATKKNVPKIKPAEIAVTATSPLFSLRRLAEYFDCYTEDGKPATDTVLEWWHSGRIPPVPKCGTAESLNDSFSNPPPNTGTKVSGVDSDDAIGAE